MVLLIAVFARAALSDLLSVSLQEVQVTPVRPVVRNREVAARYDEPGSSSQQQQQQAASTQERVKHLQKEVRCVELGLVLVVSGLGH